MCCSSHLCLDPRQTWISCFHLCLQTLYLQNMIPMIRPMVFFTDHHPLTHTCCPVPRDTSTLWFCPSFWNWSLCLIYRLFLELFYSSSGFPPIGAHPFMFLDHSLDTEMGCLMHTLRVVSPRWSEDKGLLTRFPRSKPSIWSFRLTSTSVPFPVLQTFPCLLFCN